jgi:hypothetical protein
VNSESLQPQQIERLARTVGKIRSYFNRLTGRCHQRHFPYDDPLKVAADETLAKVQKLQEVLERLKK